MKKTTKKQRHLIFKNIRFSLGNTKKVETCAIMEREAREVQEKEYASNSKEQVCLSNATEEIYNRENKGGMRNRMKSKQ